MNTTPTDFLTKLHQKLGQAWSLFYQNIPICYITDHMESMCDLFDVIDPNRMTHEIIDSFVIAWNLAACGFPYEIHDKTHRIEQILEIYHDYLKLEDRLQ